MYETYVPIRVERKPPTIAEIVRQKTDDGARIIDFFLDVMEGRVEDAKLCHRIDAAKQLVKYGYKKAADFIAEHGDEPCDHCESRKRGPRPRKDQGPATGPLQSSPLHVQGPYGYDFLTMLTEDFLTVLSAVDEDLMIKLLRAQTRDGGTVIDFLDNVMHGREDGFRVNHRISAARELISHILRDEHAFAHAVLDNVAADPRVRPLPGSETPSPSILTPSPSTGEGWGEGDFPARGSVGAGLKPALPGAAWEPSNSPTVVRADARRNPGNTTVVPAQAGTQRGGEAHNPAPNSVHPEPNLIVVPAEAGTQGSSGARSATPNSVHPEPNTTVVPAEAGTQGSGGARSATPNSAHPELVLSDDEGPIPSAVKEPRIVRPELVEGQCSGDSAVPGPADRIREKFEAHRHEPDPYGAPIDSTHPGRSPPW